jgi:A/G-specific adenine glycosylase
MELGAVVCLPRNPVCAGCPVSGECQARLKGIQHQLPPPRKKPAMLRKERILLVIRRKGRILLAPSPRVSGFWDLPELFSGVRLGPRLGEFRHTITNSQYHFQVREARTGDCPRDCRWWDERKLDEILLSTAAKKALQCLDG